MGAEDFGFQNELDNDGILPDEDETEDDELADAGMHVEGADADEEIPEMEKDL